jgi:hypothetical protein
VKSEKENQIGRHPKSNNKSTPKITVNIEPGQVTPAQREAWRRFWAEISAEGHNDNTPEKWKAIIK